MEYRSHKAAITPEKVKGTLEVLMRGIPLPIESVSASVAVPGTGDNPQTIRNATDWESGYLLVAGYHEDDVVARDFTVEAISLKYAYDRNFLRVQGKARHAGEQAEWIADQVQELGIGNFTLHVSNFHLCRAWLTVLESLRRRDIMVPVFPVPVIGHPFEVRFLNNRSSQREFAEIDVIPGEDERILDYQKPKPDGSPGDVATVEWVIGTYLPWFYKQEMVKDALASCMR